MESIHVLDNHPLVRLWLTKLRDERTGPKEFREYMRLVSLPLIFEAVSDLVTREIVVTTPMDTASGHQLGEEVSVATILRAALPMVEAIQQVIPMAPIYHIDMHRDEDSLRPIWTRDNLPADCSGVCWLIPDPMLATGGSVVATVDRLKQRDATRIKFIGVIAAPEGIAAVQERHPDVQIYVAVVDSHLNKIGYIVPGLGDAGDRLFGTT